MTNWSKEKLSVETKSNGTKSIRKPIVVRSLIQTTTIECFFQSPATLKQEFILVTSRNLSRIKHLPPISVHGNWYTHLLVENTKERPFKETSPLNWSNKVTLNTQLSTQVWGPTQLWLNTWLDNVKDMKVLLPLLKVVKMNKSKPSSPSQRNVVFVVLLMRTERKYSTERKIIQRMSLIQSAKF